MMATCYQNHEPVQTSTIPRHATRLMKWRTRTVVIASSEHGRSLNGLDIDSGLLQSTVWEQMSSLATTITIRLIENCFWCNVSQRPHCKYGSRYSLAFLPASDPISDRRKLFHNHQLALVSLPSLQQYPGSWTHPTTAPPRTPPPQTAASLRRPSSSRSSPSLPPSCVSLLLSPTSLLEVFQQ